MTESDAAFDARLCKVIAQADTDVLADDFLWVRLGPDEPPRADAIACVKDGTAWHQFVPADAASPADGRFKVVCFRFAEQGPSAIGFVAWLHSHLRIMGRTGAIVICGKDVRDSSRLFQVCQGVMDYWACPVGPAGDRFIGVIQSLIERGRSL